MRIIPFAAALVIATTTAWSADFSGRWEIAGRQFGKFPHFRLINDGRLDLKAEGGGTYSGSYSGHSALRFSGREEKDGLHLACTNAAGACGALVLTMRNGALSGGGLIGGEHIDITGRRPAMRPGTAGRQHDFTPKEFTSLFADVPQPALRLFPGDTVRTETVDNRGYDGRGVHRTAQGNPLTGPFYVEGAMPGDTLVVHIRRVRINRDSAFQSASLALNALTPAHVQSLPKSDGSLTEWRLDSAAGTARLADGSEKLRDWRVALEPMLGCIGVAPPRDQAYASSNLGPWGGNLDSRMIREGSTVHLPVFQPGAMLYIGDSHAQQADGELPGQALETSMDVEFSVELVEGKNLGQAWVENADEVAVMGVGGSLDESFRVATSGMSHWLTDRYGLGPTELAAVLGSAMRYEIAEVVDPQINVVAKIRKDMLARIRK